LTRKKRRTREHVIGDLAVNHMERQVLLCGFTLQRIASDYGLDCFIKTYNARGEVANGLIWLQVKATDHPRWGRHPDRFAVRVFRKDLVHWIGEEYPVILTVYDPAADRAFWLHVQDEFQRGKVFELPRTGASMMLQVPSGHVVNEQAVREFRRRKVSAQGHWGRGGRGDE